MRKQRGSKLLELVVVMAIICILMACYLPALISAKRKAQETSDYLSGNTTPPGRRSYAASDFVAVESPDEGMTNTSGGSTGSTTGGTTGSNRKTGQVISAISPQ
jgi:Tfp pilus assembly major pilin PilA